MTPRRSDTASPGVTPTSVTLSWNSSTSSNVAGYNVYRGASSVGPYTKLNAALVAGTTYTDASVQANQTYYYVAPAVDGSNNQSAFSGPPAQAVTP